MGVYLLSLTAFACCSKMSSRHILYLLGFLLFLVTVVVFGIFFLLTFTSIIFNSGCSYMSASITNSTNFVSIYPSMQPMSRNWE